MKIKEDFLKDKYIRKIHKEWLNTHDLSEMPICKCGKEYVGFNRPSKLRNNRIFKIYCSPECQKEYSKINPIFKDKNALEALYIKFKTIKELSEHLNISENCLVKHLRKHNLVNIDARRSSESQILLEDKPLAEKLYITDNLTMREIAKMYNTSVSTVSVYFKKFNIKPKPSNSYPVKHGKISKAQQEIGDFIESLGFQIEHNNRSILGGKEIDIDIKNNEYCIEYNGLYHHLYRPNEVKEGLKKDYKYHLNKTIACQKVGKKLIHIFDDEWVNKSEIVKDIIRAKLGHNTRIFARKCVIKEISLKDKNKFLNENHIQGQDSSNIRLGLFYNDKLMSVMTFAKSRYNKSLYDYELSRFACENGYSVVGGFSKLLTYAIKNNLIRGNLVSYADRRISQGDVYIKNDFMLTRYNTPSYFYVNIKNAIKRYSRQWGMKCKWISRGADKNLTELEMAESLGYGRVYDCGTITFVKKID